MKPSIRALGVKDEKGRLLTVAEASQRSRGSSTMLTEIGLDDISGHLIMIYFYDFEPSKLDYAISAFQKKYQVELRSATDKRGREYYWRVVRDTSKRRSGKSSYRSRVENEARRAYWRREHPEIDYLQDADHWMDMADDLGCDPITLAGNLD